MSHVTCVNESCHMCEWVMSHVWMSHVTHVGESCHMCEWVMSHMCEWVMSHMCEWVMSHIWMSHVTHMNESCHTCVNESCHKRCVLSHNNVCYTACVLYHCIYAIWLKKTLVIFFPLFDYMCATWLIYLIFDSLYDIRLLVRYFHCLWATWLHVWYFTGSLLFHCTWHCTCAVWLQIWYLTASVQFDWVMSHVWMTHYMCATSLHLSYFTACVQFNCLCAVCLHKRVCFLCTGWPRPIGRLKLQVILRKRATIYRALLHKMTYKDKASYGSSPPCSRLTTAPRRKWFMSETWLVHTCDMTHPFMCGTWLLHTCDMTHSYVL